MFHGLEDVMALVFFLVVVLVLPLAWIVTSHLRRMAELRVRQSQPIEGTVAAELREVAREIADLRDNSIQHDLQLDAAIQRLGGRLSRVEGRLGLTEPQEASAPTRQG